MKYDTNKDFTVSEEQLALKWWVKNQRNKINNLTGNVKFLTRITRVDKELKEERLKLRLYERAYKKLVDKYKDRETGYTEENCPICGRILEDGWAFCPDCGQALKWEEDEE